MNSEPLDGQGVWHYDETVNICNTYIFFLLPNFFYVHIYAHYVSASRYDFAIVSVFVCVCVTFKVSSALWLLLVQLVCVAIVFFGSSVLLVCYWAG